MREVSVERRSVDTELSRDLDGGQARVREHRPRHLDPIGGKGPLSQPPRLHDPGVPLPNHEGPTGSYLKRRNVLSAFLPREEPANVRRAA